MIGNGVNGFLERKQGGKYEGFLEIDGVDISPIEGMYFKENGKAYLWLKRKPILEYDFDKCVYIKRAREPRWEAYLEKKNEKTIAYEGFFFFLHFKYRIVGIWDIVLKKERMRINFFVERLERREQTLINNIKNIKDGGI